MAKISFIEFPEEKWKRFIELLNGLGMAASFIGIFMIPNLLVKTAAILLTIILLIVFYIYFIKKSQFGLLIFVFFILGGLFAFFSYCKVIKIDLTGFPPEPTSQPTPADTAIVLKQTPCPTQDCNCPIQEPNNDSPIYEFIDGKIHSDEWHSTASIDQTYKGNDKLILNYIVPKINTGLLISFVQENPKIHNEAISTKITGDKEISFDFKVNLFSTPKYYPGYVFIGFSPSENYYFDGIYDDSSKFIFFVFSSSSDSSVCIGGTYYNCEGIPNFDNRSWNVQSTHKIKIVNAENSSSLYLCEENEDGEKNDNCIFVLDFTVKPPEATHLWIGYYFRDPMDFQALISKFERK